MLYVSDIELLVGVAGLTSYLAHTQPHLETNTFPPYNWNFVRLQRCHLVFDSESDFSDTFPLFRQLLCSVTKKHVRQRGTEKHFLWRSACLCAVTCLELCVDALWKLLFIGFEELSSRLERFKVLLVTYLSISYGHEVSHYAHQTCVVPIWHLRRKTTGCVLEKTGQFIHTVETKKKLKLDFSVNKSDSGL